MSPHTHFPFPMSPVHTGTQTGSVKAQPKPVRCGEVSSMFSSTLEQYLQHVLHAPGIAGIKVG